MKKWRVHIMIGSGTSPYSLLDAHDQSHCLMEAVSNALLLANRQWSHNTAMDCSIPRLRSLLSIVEQASRGFEPGLHHQHATTIPYGEWNIRCVIALVDVQDEANKEQLRLMEI